MITPGIKESIDGYIDHGYKTGGFLRAVLTNDLFTACASADIGNRLALFEICVYICNFAPRACWGSAKMVDAWLALHKENPTEATRLASADAEARAAY